MTVINGSAAGGLAGFVLVQRLMQHLVRQKTLVPEEAADIAKAAIDDLQGSTIALRQEAIQNLEAVRQEFAAKVK